ncbi:hypothetical protein EVAR_33462_1 [Eumeta japonica]|uniref:Uncharacterized protein n=1 Tax=Eumeta variegata TaxID=151549 RepID=A0A4C1WEC9_EUMVA|nr:hypothetical protein EVAR_33462_1 [Eumeta japonica]
MKKRELKIFEAGRGARAAPHRGTAPTQSIDSTMTPVSLVVLDFLHKKFEIKAVRFGAVAASTITYLFGTNNHNFDGGRPDRREPSQREPLNI